MSDQFKHLPPGWSPTRIGDFTAEKVTQIKPVPPFNYIDISSINNTNKTIESPKTLTPSDTVPSRARQQLQSDDILVSMTRPNLNAVAQVPAEFNGSIASTGFHVLRPFSVSSNWLFAYVRSKGFIDSLVAQVQGALYPAIRPDDIRSHEIALPPLSEQQRIAAKIESLQGRSSRARAALAEVGPLLEQFRRSVLSAAFSGRLTADWRAANPDVEPASELLHRIRTERRQKWEQAELAKYEAKGRRPPKDWQDKYEAPVTVHNTRAQRFTLLPNSWRVETFDAFLESITSGSRGWAKYYSDHGPLFIRSQNINTDVLDLTDVAHVSPPKGSEGSRTRIRQGDLLITITGANVAKAAAVHCKISEAYVSQHVALARPVDPLLTAYLHLWTTSADHGRLQLLTDAYGNGKPGLNLDNLRQMQVAVPPIAEQQVILQAVSESFNTIGKVEATMAASNLSLTQLDQSILAKAFRGELVPQDPADEPAAELLARIAAARAGAPTKLNKRTGRPTKQK